MRHSFDCPNTKWSGAARNTFFEGCERLIVPRSQGSTSCVPVLKYPFMVSIEIVRPDDLAGTLHSLRLRIRREPRTATAASSGG
jgi:hypothetical protein